MVSTYVRLCKTSIEPPQRYVYDGFLKIAVESTSLTFMIIQTLNAFSQVYRLDGLTKTSGSCLMMSDCALKIS